MIPEAGLMAALVIVFLADLILKGEKKHTTLSLLTGLLLVAQIAVCFTAEPAEAFAGLYTATAAAQVMKVILTAGAFIVVVMAQSWLEQKDVQNKEGEFYELIISTLLGMYMMISSGHFLMFFLGLEMASVPMACLVAFDKFKKESAEGAAAFALMTILTKVFAPMVEYWEMLMYIVIVLTITIANLFALRQTELKRFMAFSSISQAGYIMLAAVGNGAMGLPALMYYVLIYVAANMSVFTIINVVETRGKGNTEMSVFDGFYTTNPKLSFLMTLALFSLAGIPPFAGMFCKFFVFMAAAEQGSNIAYAVVFLALINTVPSLYYYLKIVKCMYINKTDAPLAPFKSDCATRTALALCTAGVLLFGVCSCVYGWLVAATAM